MPSIARRTILIVLALPAAALSLALRMVGADTATSRRPLTPVTGIALFVTAPFWLLLTFRGVLYPAFGADDLDQSWGGPTLVGAWVTHLVVGLAALGVASLAVALATGSRWSNVSDGSGPRSF